MSLSLWSVNARGLRNVIKRKALFLFMKEHKADFCLFQECHSTKKDFNFWTSHWGNQIWLAHGSEYSAGVGIFKNKFDGDTPETDLDNLGHFCFLIITLNQMTFTIISIIYGYNSSAENHSLINTLDTKLTQWLHKYPHALIIMGGDFNVVMDNRIDR
ncbi:hypothetical protein LDENG_00226450 [Lucifuga dentata]|nr:hypothetical protein LDENG_00226450 [Lucifuga dentata]